jgi:Big-like domain-containing protein
LFRRLSFIWLCALAAAAPASASSPHAVLSKAEAAMQGRAGRGVDPTGALRDLAVTLPRLHGGDRKLARRILLRPVPGEEQYGETAYTVPEHAPLCSTHFCIHWVDSTADAPPLASTLGDGVPDYVRTMDAVFEHVYQVENVQMGWRPPKPDGTHGGDLNKVDVYIQDVGARGLFGYAAADLGQHGHSQTAYLVMDNDYSHAQFPRYSSYLDPMEVTAAHEYNHAIQFGYDFFQDTWLLEATAVWMEDRVYDGVNDYLSYVDRWAQMPQVPVTRFDALHETDPLNTKVYGDAVWNRWLDLHFGQQLIRNAWERSVGTSPSSFAPGAYDAALRARGSSFFDAFTSFVADTAEWRSSAGPFGDRDGSLWPDVQRASTRLAPGQGDVSGRLDHTAYRLFDVAPTHDTRIKLVASLPAGNAGAVALVGRVGSATSGQVQVALTRLPNGGAGTATLTDPSRFSRITAVVVNADTREAGYSESAVDWKFTRDGQLFHAHVSNRFAALRLRGSDPRAGATKVSRTARIVLRFSATLRATSLDRIRLVGPHGTSVPVRVTRGHRGRRVTLIPDRPLGRSTQYRVKLGRRIFDVDGNALRAKHRSWDFATR